MTQCAFETAQASCRTQIPLCLASGVNRESRGAATHMTSASRSCATHKGPTERTPLRKSQLVYAGWNGPLWRWDHGVVQLLQRLDCRLRAVTHGGGELCTAPALPTCLHHVLPARDGLDPALIDAKLDEVLQERAEPSAA